MICLPITSHRHSIPSSSLKLLFVPSAALRSSLPLYSKLRADVSICSCLCCVLNTVLGTWLIGCRNFVRVPRIAVRLEVWQSSLLYAPVCISILTSAQPLEIEWECSGTELWLWRNSCAGDPDRPLSTGYICKAPSVSASSFSIEVSLPNYESSTSWFLLYNNV